MSKAESYLPPSQITIKSLASVYLCSGIRSTCWDCECADHCEYDCGAADGIFGAKTETAVRAFQRDHNLTVDGIAGKDTQAALYAAEDAPKPTYTVTLRNVPQADAVQLTAKYGGEMVQTEHERTA